MKNELIQTYKRVLEKFPEIREDELEFRMIYLIPNFVAGLTLYDRVKYAKTGEITGKPALNFGYEFFNLNPKEQEVVIAHELGHYKKDRKKNHEELKKLAKRLTKLYTAMTGCGEQLDPLEAKLIKQWGTARELYADKQVVKIGLGKELLELYKRMPINDTEAAKARKAARIAKLEKLVGEQNV